VILFSPMEFIRVPTHDTRRSNELEITVYDWRRLCWPHIFSDSPHTPLQLVHHDSHRYFVFAKCMKQVITATVTLLLTSFDVSADTSDVPMDYSCDNGTRLTLSNESDSIDVWMPDDGPVYKLPARYSQGYSWFFQIEPQEMDCHRYCVELNFRGPVTAYVRIGNQEFECRPKT
jgi:hypothetical protein